MAATVWKEQLTFGLASMPVRLYRAARRRDSANRTAWLEWRIKSVRRLLRSRCRFVRHRRPLQMRPQLRPLTFRPLGWLGNRTLRHKVPTTLAIGLQLYFA